MNTGHESNTYIEIYFQHLLPPLCSFMKVIDPSRFTFSIYYPRWVSSCNSLIGREGNSSIEIYFQHLLPPLFYCCACLWLVFFLVSYVISFSNLLVSIFLMIYFPPCSSSLVDTLLKVRLGFRCAFQSMQPCLLRIVPTLLWWISLFAINQASTFKLSAQIVSVVVVAPLFYHRGQFIS